LQVVVVQVLTHAEQVAEQVAIEQAQERLVLILVPNQLSL
jgi:hypothetical protein